MSDAADAHPPRRQKFLVVVDDTPEVQVAVRYASRRAAKLHCGVVMLRVVEPVNFQQWAGVAELMRREAHEAAEKLMLGLAEQVQSDSGVMPEISIREGNAADELLKLIAEDMDIRMLVLAAAPSGGGSGPGPLVTKLAGQMSGDLSFPITVVPGNLSAAQIDRIT